VSDPLSDFTRHEHWMTAQLNIAARNGCAGCRTSMRRILALPGNDFWLFDDHTIRFGYFTGDWNWPGKRCAATRM
jgi:hypothetical protein